MLREWKDDLRRFDVSTKRDLILQLMKHGVLSVSTTNEPVKQRFLEVLKKHAIPFGP